MLNSNKMCRTKYLVNDQRLQEKLSNFKDGVARYHAARIYRKNTYAGLITEATLQNDFVGGEYWDWFQSSKFETVANI